VTFVEKIVIHINQIMKKTFLSIISMIALLSVTNAQTEEKESFGKPFVKIFSNFHNSFSDGESQNMFEITRAYFGYEYTFNSNFSGKLTLDVGNPGAGKLQQTAFLKTAYLQYKKDGFSISMGLLGLVQFKEQETNWGYRYIYKSFQDEHKYNSSADLGMIVAYKFTDAFSMDLSITNGEGYKTVVVDSVLRTGIGATFKPTKDFTIRAYYDFIKKDEITQQSLALFAGYSTTDWTFGAEYNQLLNVKNAEDRDLSGYSFYTTYKSSKKTKIFARYDQLSSNEISGNDWNIVNDGSQFIIGMEFSPVKGVKIAPNYQGWNPKDDSKKILSAIFLNLELKL
jgi:hypothetical protein